MGILSSLGKSLYKGATSKPGMIGIIGGAAALGVASQAAPAARDAAMDVAFGDPNADTAFLGRKLTPGALIDATIPGSAAGENAAISTGILGAVRCWNWWYRWLQAWSNIISFHRCNR